MNTTYAESQFTYIFKSVFLKNVFSSKTWLGHTLWLHVCARIMRRTVGTFEVHSRSSKLKQQTLAFVYLLWYNTPRDFPTDPFKPSSRCGSGLLIKILFFARFHFITMKFAQFGYLCTRPCPHTAEVRSSFANQVGVCERCTQINVKQRHDVREFIQFFVLALCVLNTALTCYNRI